MAEPREDALKAMGNTYTLYTDCYYEEKKVKWGDIMSYVKRKQMKQTQIPLSLFRRYTVLGSPERAVVEMYLSAHGPSWIAQLDSKA